MAQTLLIGLGGTGSRVVNNVAKKLKANKQEINNGEMCCAVLDTNVNDTKNIKASNTGVPVYATSKAQKIRDYFDEYNHLHMDEWCPKSPAFLEQSMIDGASELRLKSRVAFMDCLESGVTKGLKKMINDVLKVNPDSKIRIMIVSSLSGGTGSGMFIQVALWLRKHLSESQITIRGIFLLPDVFISTVDDIRNNKTTTVRHYCNAYAAIRELNAITKIKKDNSLELPAAIKVGKLFDSNKDKDSGTPVYDFAFFVDDRDEKGIVLDNIAEYEDMVAQLVYMQMYAPMRDDMYSEEDNAFLSFIENDEPLYGSCGTSKAEYPVKSIKNYCAVRAAKESLTGGWKKIDDEIKALADEKKNSEKDGIFSKEQINEREKFVKLFEDEISKDPEKVGKDRFFLSIAKDIKNEVSEKNADDKIIVTYTDKVLDFEKDLSNQIDEYIAKNSNLNGFVLNKESFIAGDADQAKLFKQISTDERRLIGALDEFDEGVNDDAETLLGEIFPFSMGMVNPDNDVSIYGLLTKPVGNDAFKFVHPVAARYLLYKLIDTVEEVSKGINLTNSRADAISGKGDAGGNQTALFDNPKTKVTETKPKEFLEAGKSWTQSEEKFLKDFKTRYVQFFDTKVSLCRKYQKESLQKVIYDKLAERTKGLVKHLEFFFKHLDDVEEKLADVLESNIASTEGTVGKTVYVCGSKEYKDTVYKSLDLELNDAVSDISKSVIDAVYGKYCAEKRPSNPYNAPYAEISISRAFIKDIVKAFGEKVNDENNNEVIDIDIYSALCKESDALYEADKKEEEKKNRRSKKNELEDFDIESGEDKNANAKELRRKIAFIECRDKLLAMASPLLIHNKEISDNELGTRTARTKIFWGFSPDLAESCDFVGQELGINADLQADAAYPKNELYCYRAVYGMEAKYVPKFNELEGGDYFTCYNSVINSMVSDAEGKQGDRAYVRTPHLDKNWHKILPYITPEKQGEDWKNFFHGFWLAVAYGVIGTDKDGKFYIKRLIDGGFGDYIEENVPVKFKNKNVTKTDVAKLIEILRADKVFTGTEVPALEKKFAGELEDMVTYVGTEVLKGLTTSNEDLNPVNVVSRYNESLKHDVHISAALITSLEKIAMELAERYNTERTEEKLEEAKYKICRKIYDSSKRSKGKANIFSKWEKAFKNYGITAEKAASKKGAAKKTTKKTTKKASE